MHCMKCGKEISDEQVFCKDCLVMMDAYPVSPDTVVHIPHRASRPVEKKHRELTAREQISQLHKTVRWLILTVMVLTVALLLTAAMLLHQLDQTPNPVGNPLGRNYTTQEQP